MFFKNYTTRWDFVEKTPLKYHEKYSVGKITKKILTKKSKTMFPFYVSLSFSMTYVRLKKSVETLLKIEN